MLIQIKNNLFNSRLAAVLLLGFSSGLPLALTGPTLQAWFTEAGVGLVTIGAVSLVGLPYIFKFLWAPLMDRYSIFQLGRRHGWILAMQAGLVVTLFLLAQLDPASQTLEIGLIALAIAFFSASQDVAVDAYRTDLLTSAERGLGAAYYVFAYRAALLVSGGLALVLADFIGWKLTYELMAILILCTMLPTYKAPAVNVVDVGTTGMVESFIVPLRELLQRDRIIILLCFIVFYKFGDALALSLMTTFLLHGIGFSLSEVGLAYKLVSFIATISGAFVGGYILLRSNLFRALLLFGLLQAGSNLMFVVLAVAGKHFFLMASAVFIENFCSGLSTAAFLAFLMSLCNHRYTAGQYALLSAVASLSRVFIGPFAGLMVEQLGWVQFYLWTFVLSFPGIVFLILLKEKVLSYAHATVN